MSGMDLIKRVKKFEETANRLGFMLSYPKWGNSNGDYGDRVGLKPLNDALPIYSRDAEVFMGTMEQCENWIRGIQWAREYDEMLKLSNVTKRAKKEEDVRHDQMISALRGKEQLSMIATTK